MNNESKEFLKEYKALCEKYGLLIGSDFSGSLYLYQIEKNSPELLEHIANLKYLMEEINNE